MNEITIPFAFLAGLVSFLSPCVLPIIPGFLAYLAGSSLGDKQTKRYEIFLSSLFFVIGFSSVFSLVGILLNAVLSGVQGYTVQLWLARIGGTVIIVFGLFLTGLIHIPFLEREHKIRVTHKFNSRYLTAFLFGAAFAAGWTPCVGAVLGAVFVLAATHPGSAFFLLFAYSLGLGLPFLLVGVFASRATELINKYAGALHIINIIFGVLLIVIGVHVFTENLERLVNLRFLNQILLK